MKAIAYEKFGGPEVLQIRELEPPEKIGVHEVLVHVKAAGINPVDWRIRNGQYKALLFFKNKPFVPGSDIAGLVVKCGPGVVEFKEGDEVYGMLNPLSGGAYEEFSKVSIKHLTKKPANLSFEEAAAVPLAALTALQALRDKAHIKSGQKILINGASGGVGTFAVQIGKIYGAHVTGVCSNNNMALVRDLGADEVIDYKTQDFTQINGSYDIIFDTVGNRPFRSCENVLSKHGVHVTTLPDSKTFLNIARTVLGKGKKAKALIVRSDRNDLNQIREWIEAGRMRPVISKVYPLEDVVQAHVDSQSHHASGKLVLRINEVA